MFTFIPRATRSCTRHEGVWGIEVKLHSFLTRIKIKLPVILTLRSIYYRKIHAVRSAGVTMLLGAVMFPTALSVNVTNTFSLICLHIRNKVSLICLHIRRFQSRTYDFTFLWSRCESWFPTLRLELIFEY